MDCLLPSPPPHHPRSCSAGAVPVLPSRECLSETQGLEVNVECQYCLVVLLTLTSYWLLIRTASHSWERSIQIERWHSWRSPPGVLAHYSVQKHHVRCGYLVTHGWWPCIRPFLLWVLSLGGQRKTHLGPDPVAPSHDSVPFLVQGRNSEDCSQVSNLRNFTCSIITCYLFSTYLVYVTITHWSTTPLRCSCLPYSLSVECCFCLNIIYGEFGWSFLYNLFFIVMWSDLSWTVMTVT